MENIARELNISTNNIFPTVSPNTFSAVVNIQWLRKWLKNTDVDNSLHNLNRFQPSESISYPQKKILIKVLPKKVSKVLPLPRYKFNESNTDVHYTFSQLLQYVSQYNQRNLWKDSYKKYCENNESCKETTVVNLLEHDQLLSDIIVRLYGCNIVKLKDGLGKFNEYKDMPNKNVPRPSETHMNLLSALCAVETDNNFYIIYRGHYENHLLDCLNFSPSLIDKSYSRGLFIIYQILHVSKSLYDRGLSIGALMLQDIYLSEDLWLQILPPITNNIYCLDPSLICEQNRSKQNAISTSSVNSKETNKVEEWCWRNDAVQLEKLCMLWVRGRISNLDYLLHLNILAGRSPHDPQAHFMVPWVTDFHSRCGQNWRDMSKSKYRLNKGDRQLDMTFEVTNSSGQIPHHVTDALTDITCYVYLARRTSKAVLCEHVRNKWVPAEYPASIQRMQEWTPDECIPEFYTDPTAFKSIHEDLPDLGIPSWATCVEDFITKHREALESVHVSENLHHWIDITFGYKLSGSAAVKAKNVCLALVDGHTTPRRGTMVQLLTAPHPPRKPRAPPPAPPRLRWTAPRDTKKPTRDSSEEMSDEDEESTCLPQHISRLSTPTQRIRRHKSTTRARSLSKNQDEEASTSEARASSHSRHFRVQRSEMGKGVIYLPKEFNPVATIQALETLDNFRTKCFFSKAEDKNKYKENVSLNLCSVEKEIENPNSARAASDDTAYTNHMFLATYDQAALKRINHDANLDGVLKERKNRMFIPRYTTPASVYKQFVVESRKQDMLVIGCLIVEIFLHSHMRPLRLNSDNFTERYNSCRTVLKYNFNTLPKCVSYIASLLLNVEPLHLSFRTELHPKNDKKIIITDKGLPPPTPSQLLQPLLVQHLIPFPQNFNILYNLLSTLHEFNLTSNELYIMYTYECDGLQCEKFQNVDKTKLHFIQRIAEGKIQACITHLSVLLNQITNENQFNILDILLQHYIQLLKNKDTSVLAAWHLFDTISKALGPAETKEKLLKHILNLYEDDDYIYDRTEHKDIDVELLTNTSLASKQKFVKLYHHIFLLQLMVRLGLQCFLDNFIQHLVEAVGGYKDVSSEIGSPGHVCDHRTMLNKKPRYSDDHVKNALTAPSDIFSPDTSYGSEHIVTPNREVTLAEVHEVLEKDADAKSENDLFHFETDRERISTTTSNSRSRSPTGSVDSLTPKDTLQIPSPANDFISQGNSRFFTGLPNKIIESEITSPTVDIPISLEPRNGHFDGESPSTDGMRQSHVRKLNFGVTITNDLEKFEKSVENGESNKISDMSSESLIWLSHRLGPVLTCRYITRNLLKMLTLCYIGKENLAQATTDVRDEFDEISIVNSKVVGDKNAIKVIKCLTSIVAMYGEQLIIFQYLPHMGELIASCRRRLSTPLEGGVVAYLQLIKYLMPFMSDVKVMEQLQDTFLKSILQPALRLAATSRSSYPSGAAARAALTRKLLDALYALAVRVGPEMTRKLLCVPALQRFFLAFDKASGKSDNWPKQEEANFDKVTQEEHVDPKMEGFLEICRDGSTAEWAVRDGRVVRADLPELAYSPPSAPDKQDATTMTAQEELLTVFNEELAHHAYHRFAKLIGADTLDRCLKNVDTVRALCAKYKQIHASSEEENHRQSIDIARPRPDTLMDQISSSNSFGSNVMLVGNRLDVAAAPCEAAAAQADGFDVVAYKMDAGFKNDRHLRGDWLIYWEHEIGRADKEARFNLKQIKLQTFIGHTHTVKSIHCLDNENSFMSGSKDKTVRLWSLRNQGDGNAITQCNWSYTGHKKGVLSLAFVESLRLAVSTDSVVHVWDPFMESVVSQFDHIKSAVSIVRTLPGPSCAVLAATNDATLRIIDPRSAANPPELKVMSGGSAFIRCMCVDPAGGWVCAGLSSGQVAVLDTRTGTPRAMWRAHDGEVLRVAAVDERRVLSSGLDQSTALWRVDDGELITHLKGTTEPVHCLSLYRGELISGTTNNRIGVHTSLDQDASFSSTKLRSDTFKGVLTCMSVLPLNRLLLLGSDNGTISLLC